MDNVDGGSESRLPDSSTSLSDRKGNFSANELAAETKSCTGNLAKKPNCHILARIFALTLRCSVRHHELSAENSLHSNDLHKQCVPDKNCNKVAADARYNAIFQGIYMQSNQ